MKNKRAQTEAIGLIIIVMIVIIGMIFMMTRNSKNDYLERESYSDPKLAQSFLNVLMETEIGNYGVMKDIISNCHDNRKKNLCGGDCCDYAKQTIKNSLALTLDEWQKPYFVTVKQNNKESFNISTEDCDRYSSGYKLGQYTIPAFPKSIHIEMKICKIE